MTADWLAARNLHLIARYKASVRRNVGKTFLFLCMKAMHRDSTVTSSKFRVIKDNSKYSTKLLLAASKYKCRHRRKSEIGQMSAGLERARERRGDCSRSRIAAAKRLVIY